MNRRSERARYLYRWFDADGVLLYIGITVKPSNRRQAHRRESAWYPWADRSEISPPFMATLDAAESIEAAAIAAEAPLFNKRGAGPVARQSGRLYLESKGADPDAFRTGNPIPRQVRIATDDWFAFRVAAESVGRERAQILREFIEWYLHKPGSSAPNRAEG